MMSNLKQNITELLDHCQAVAKLLAHPIQVEEPGGMTLTECYTALALYMGGKHFSIEITAKPSYKHHERPEVEVSIWDGDDHYKGPTISLAYKTFAEALEPKQENPLEKIQEAVSNVPF